MDLCFVFNCQEEQRYQAVIAVDTNSRLLLNNVTFTLNQGTSRGVCIAAYKGAFVNAANINTIYNGGKNQVLCMSEMMMRCFNLMILNLKEMVQE